MTADARIFAACAPGLEALLAAELRALGLEARPVPGGAEASGPDAVALACLGSRLADAVGLRLFEGPEHAIGQALASARRRYGRDAPLAVRRAGDRSTVSLDATGAPLFRRGWRARVGAAPLRETLAAGLLAAAGHDGRAPVVDPMCGSGTIALEAAALATGRAPGTGRSFAFERWPDHDPARTATVRARLAAAERSPSAPVHASDRNAGALRLAQKNAAAGGFGFVRFERRDAAEVELPAAPGLLAVNPPYGVRLDHDVAAAWRSLDRLLARALATGWRAAVLAPDRGYPELLGRRPDGSSPVRNGGLACSILLYGA